MKRWIKSRLQTIRIGHTAQVAALAAVAVALMGTAVDAYAEAAGTSMSFPLIDSIMCGFLGYLRSKMAPVIAVIVVILSMVGHWLGAAKVWGTLLYVGLGLGLIMGIGSMVATYSTVGAACIQ